MINETKVNVALFGQPGSGKSSLANQLLGREHAKVGVGTDTTVEASWYEWDGVLLCDLPGYDTTRFPADKFPDQFGAFSFDLYLCVFEGKLHASDTRFFRELASQHRVCLFVRNKVDALWQEGKSEDELRAEIVQDVRQQTRDPNAKVFFTSCKTGAGIPELQSAIFEHLDEAKRDRWARAAKGKSEAFLREKHAACQTLVHIYAGLAAANALNPIPGVDVAVDAGLLLVLFKEIRDDYGIGDAALRKVEVLVPTLAPVVNDVLAWATKEGVMLLLKRFAARETTKEVAKYIPIVGQVIAASLGFWITKSAGSHYNDKCFEIAKALLQAELRPK